MTKRMPVRSYTGYLGGRITIFSDRSVTITPPYLVVVKMSIPIERAAAARAIRSDRECYGRKWPLRQRFLVLNETVERAK